MVRTHGTSSSIGDGATVGPYTYLRPGTVLGADGKLGAFVEAKNSTIGTGTKVPHLTYVGDADIGEHSNIGASALFVNYDGESKRRTTVGWLCAPVRTPCSSRRYGRRWGLYGRRHGGARRRSAGGAGGFRGTATQHRRLGGSASGWQPGGRAAEKASDGAARQDPDRSEPTPEPE